MEAMDRSDPGEAVQQILTAQSLRVIGWESPVPMVRLAITAEAGEAAVAGVVPSVCPDVPTHCLVEPVVVVAVAQAVGAPAAEVAVEAARSEFLLSMVRSQ